MPSIAPLAAGWDRWRRGFAPAPFPGGETPGSIKVELFISEAWVDVTRLDRDTPGVYYRDRIVITRGKADEAGTLDRGSCRFTLNNRDGRFSPRNPNSPYYGKIGRNTPVRVSVVKDDGVRRYRFYGEVAAWPQRWDITGTDVYVPVEASGILRRLTQASTPLDSPMHRGTTRAGSLVAYWPLEDDATALAAASAVTGIPAMRIDGTPVLASDETTFVNSSKPLPLVTNGGFTGSIPFSYSGSIPSYLAAYLGSSQYRVRFLLSIPSTGATNGQVICRVYTAGQIGTWELYYISGSGGSIGLRAYDTTGVTALDTSSAFDVDGVPMLCILDLSGSPLAGGILTGNVTQMALDGTQGGVTGNISSYGSVVGRSHRLAVAPNGLKDSTIGHVAVLADVPTVGGTDPLFSLITGHLGEVPGPRILRLCNEENIGCQGIGSSTTSAMDVQTRSSLVGLIQACVTADMGRLFEPRDQLGLGYRDRESLYNQAATLALSYTDNELTDSLDPVDDDQHTKNDVTVTREGGSSARLTLDSGALSIADVGRYDESVTVSVEYDSQLLDVAGWLLHLGTTNEARYPTIGINLQHSTYANNSAMMSAALEVDVGDRITIANLPSWLPPDQISLIVEGYAETISAAGQHTITFNCSPESPHRVGVYDDSTWRYSSDGSTLTSDIGFTSTSVSVTTPSGPVWGISDGSFDIIVGGEQMTVTAIGGSSSLQTFTLTRSVNGIVKTHSAGDTVELFQPTYYGI